MPHHNHVARRRAPRCGRASAEHTDAGFSIIDIVVAITLIGLLVLPLINAVWTSIAASATNREIAEIETVLQNAADRVNRAPVGCDYLVYVQAAAQSQGWEAERAKATYKYYVPGATALATDTGTWADGACPSTGRTANMVQLVTITITSFTGRVTRSIKVVKSDV